MTYVDGLKDVSPKAAAAVIAKGEALREATEAQQRANEELRKAAKAREKAGLPEWDD